MDTSQIRSSEISILSTHVSLARDWKRALCWSLSWTAITLVPSLMVKSHFQLKQSTGSGDVLSPSSRAV